MFVDAPRLRQVAYDIETDADLDGLMRALAAQTDLLFARVAIAPEELPRVLPERDGERLKARFRAAISVGGERLAGG